MAASLSVAIIGLLAGGMLYQRNIGRRPPIVPVPILQELPIIEDISLIILEEREDTREAASPIDFDVLKIQNKDIYAWITIPGTDIDYPILQRENEDDPYDDFYLDHTVALESGYPGAIYSHGINQKDFSDNITVLYGHNMKDGTMFTGLHKYEDMNFLKENSDIYIYTPEKTLRYKIFATVYFSDVLITEEYNVTGAVGLMDYIDAIERSPGLRRDDFEGTPSDRILTLSTCISGKEKKRLLVEAVLIDE